MTSKTCLGGSATPAWIGGMCSCRTSANGSPGCGFPGGCAARASRFSRRWRALSRSGRCSASWRLPRRSMTSIYAPMLGWSWRCHSGRRARAVAASRASSCTPSAEPGGGRSERSSSPPRRAPRGCASPVSSSCSTASSTPARRRCGIRTPTARTPHPSGRSTTSRLSSSQPTPPACRSRCTRSATRRAASPSTPSSTPTP